MVRFHRVRAVLWAMLGVALFVYAVADRAIAAEPQFPPLSGRVVDEAGVLSAPTREKITGWLEQYEQASQRQVVVATVKSLQGYPIEDFGYRLGRFWGIGEKGRNTGAILLVAPTERAVRIEVGYGLEGELTDAVSRAIIEREILPAFRQGNFEQGITAGTGAVLRALGWNGAPAATNAAPGGTVDGLVPLGFIIFIVLFAMLRHGRHGLWIVPMGHGFGGRRSGGRFSGGGGSFGGGGASGHW
ncbi:MAG: TPM domain-containing protein [Rhodospirillaceae bacterium]|nr:TPM domain-containing protein [Rhodospirillaceae bacterium]